MWHDQKLLLSVDSAFVSSAHYTSCYHPNRVTSNYTYSCITVLPSSKLSLDLQTHMNTMVLVDIIQVFALFHSRLSSCLHLLEPLLHGMVYFSISKFFTPQY